MVRVMTVGLLILILAAAGFYHFGRGYWFPVYLKYKGARSVNDVIQQYGPRATAALKEEFAQAGLVYPPQKIALLAIKDERKMELWAYQDQRWQLVRPYDLTAMSGGPGPKLREGDKQIPEGQYQIIGFNPNSAFHLSMKLNYPNPFDLKHARAEARHQPGSNIFIHGKSVSVGCLAVGDEAIEELFTLVHSVGKGNAQVIIAPSDPRQQSLLVPAGSPVWTEDLYRQLEQQFMPFQ